MKKKLIISSMLTMLFVTSCAVSKDNTYLRSDYNDPTFKNNYYTLKEESIVNNIKKTNNIELNKVNNSVFETYDELKQLGEEFDSKVANNEVAYDTVIHSNYNTTYGTENCLGKIDDSFNHGILSKLADGLLFCDGVTYQGVRVQIDQTGFVHQYEKKCVYADYFAMSFKAGSDYTSSIYTKSATYKIKLNIKLYIEEDGKFIENICSYTMDSVLRDKYYLFGFSLTKDLAFNLKGIGVSYDLISTTEDANLDQCLYLYETLFVNSSWY